MPLSLKPHIVLGIDPGTKRIGYGLIEIKGRAFKYIDAGLLIPRVAGPCPKNLFMGKIHAAIVRLVGLHSPELIAIERVYFGQNISSALAVSEVRGALTLMADECRIPVIDVHPTNVKQAVCGYGHADKTAVRKMVSRSITGLPKSLTSRDAVDALAIAITGHYASRERLFIDKVGNSGTTNTK